ncbi:hypothetical protein [Streptomyces brevispora]|uniref:hypothetical protein n=1 Tax=Streptomyces brevispora TaxID=887462 RepID=UPI0035DBDF27
MNSATTPTATPARAWSSETRSTREPIHLRRARLLAGAALPATVTVDSARSAALRAELSAARDRVTRRIMNGG